MIIAIDIDGCVLDTMGAVLNQFFQWFKKPVTEYWLTNLIPGVEMEYAVKCFEELNWRNVEFIGRMYILQFLWRLEQAMKEKKKLECFFLTNKTPKMVEWTERIFKHYQIKIPIIVSANKEKYTFDILIEDDPAIITKVSKEKLRFIRQEYNKHLEAEGYLMYDTIEDVIKPILNTLLSK